MDAAVMMLMLNAGQLHVDHDDRSAAGRLAGRCCRTPGRTLLPDAAAGRLAGRCCRTPGRTLLPDALDSGFHGVRTHWIRGFMAFQLARRAGW
jgi:hypothetical protein